MEKDQERVHKKVDNTFYGVLVAAVVQMLQQKKGDEELIHFKEIHDGVNEIATMNADTIAERLGIWASDDNILADIRGKLEVYRKNKKNEEPDEYEKYEGYKILEFSDTYKYGGEIKNRWGEEKEKKKAKTASYRKYKTAYFHWTKPPKKSKFSSVVCKNRSNQKIKNGDEVNLKKEFGECTDVIIEILKEKENSVGNGIEVTNKVNDYIMRNLYIETDNIVRIHQKTILHHVLKLLKPTNKELLELLNIEVALGREYNYTETDGEKEVAGVEYTQVRHKLGCDPDEIEELKFEEENKVDYLKKMHIQFCDKSEVWKRMWTQNWEGPEDLAYMRFVLNLRKLQEYEEAQNDKQLQEHEKSQADENARNFDGKKLVAYEILKMVCDNQMQIENLSREEIKEGLFEYIPDTYINREEFDDELDRALEYLPYVVFDIKCYQYGEIWAISYEILKLLCDNQTQTEGLSKEEIREGLFQHIPKEFMDRGNEFDEEFEEALKFIEEEGIAEKLTGERWILGEKI